MNFIYLLKIGTFSAASTNWTGFFILDNERQKGCSKYLK
jgi:hypothetical protein